MAKKIVIKSADETGQYLWSVLSESAGIEPETGSLADLKQWLGDESCQLVFLAPAADILVREIGFSERERKHVLKTVPYLLEESVIGDVDELHIITDKPASNTVQVAAVEQDKMAEWLNLFEQAGLGLSQCLPEQLVLTPSQSWSLFYYDHQYLFRDAEGKLHAIDESTIDLAMHIATEQFAALPTSISVLAINQLDADRALAELPDPLKHLVALSVKPFSMLAFEGLSGASVWNLLQGRFAHTAKWSAIWRQWQAVVIVLGIALVVHVGVSVSQYQTLDGLNLSLRQDIETVHRSIFPKGQIVDPRRQMENELKRLQGGGGGEGFVYQLVKVGGVMAGAEGLELNSITYDEKNGDIRVDLLVQSFQEVEKIRTGVEQLGMEAELLNSNAQGEKLRARLRIKG